MANDHYRRQDQYEAGQFSRSRDHERNERGSQPGSWEGDDHRQRQRFGGRDWEDDSGSGRRNFGETDVSWNRGTSFGERVGGGFGGQRPGRGFGDFESDMTEQGYGDRGFSGSSGMGHRDPGSNYASRAAQFGRQATGQFQGRGPKGYERTDSRIREDACDRLCDDADVDATEIEVNVEKGEVTLSGTVQSRDQKRRAEDCVEEISGVKNVQNNLRVSPKSSSESDYQIAGTTTTSDGANQSNEANKTR